MSTQQFNISASCNVYYIYKVVVIYIKYNYTTNPTYIIVNSLYTYTHIAQHRFAKVSIYILQNF